LNNRADIVDIAVVGGGIFGCALAHRAASELPGRTIALFEQGAIGGGCSGFAGAIATPAVRSERVRALSDESRDWYARYRGLHSDAPMRELPIVYVASPARVDALRAALTADALRDGRGLLPPWLRTDPSAHVLLAPPAVWADVRVLCAHLLSKSPGVLVHEGARIDNAHRVGQAWRLRLADGREIGARRLVMAKGAWFEPSERDALAGMRNKKIVAYAIDMPVVASDPVVYLYDHEAFLLPLPARGQWLLSIVSSGWDCHPDRDPMQPAASDLATAVGVLSHYAPTLLPALRGARVHCDGYLDDHRPCATVVDGAICMHGGSGSGFRYAPAVAASALSALAQAEAGGAPER